MKGKLAGESRVTIIHRPLPEEANHAGNIYGGNIMRHMDAVGGIAAVRHARAPVVTAAVEYMAFRSPIKPNEIMLFHASINAVWHSSMEVGIRTEAEDPFTGNVRHVCTCYLTFVGVDKNGKPVPLPPIIPETEEDHRRMADATRRMALSRMEHKHEGTRMSALSLVVEPQTFALCKLPPDAPMPDVSVFPPDAFMTISRSRDELSLVLEESAALLLSKKHPNMEISTGFACLRVAEPHNLHKVGMLASLSTMLASVQIPVFSISTHCTNYVLMQAEHLDKAVERLRTAGHTVE